MFDAFTPWREAWRDYDLGRSLFPWLGALLLAFLATSALWGAVLLFMVLGTGRYDYIGVLVASSAAGVVGLLTLGWVLRRLGLERPTLLHGPGWGFDLRAMFIGAGLMIAASLGVLGFVAIQNGWPLFEPMETILADFILILGLGGIGIWAFAHLEEVIFRGLLLPALASRMHWIFAVLLSSAAFAIAHIGHRPNDLLSVFFGGVVLAISVLRTGSLAVATGGHFGWNFSLNWVLHEDLYDLGFGAETEASAVDASFPIESLAIDLLWLTAVWILTPYLRVRAQTSSAMNEPDV